MAKSHELRKTVLEMCIKAKTGHVTSCFSCVEIMEALYYHVMTEDDKFVLSKGQASPLLYAILADKGIIEEDLLWSFAQTDGVLGVHLDHHIPGALITAGSLGHGLGISTGMAYARKLTGKPGRIYCLIGDGECYEGAIWEAAQFAGEYKIDNLTTIVDWNSLMVTRETALYPFEDKWRAFGWDVSIVDGHNSEMVMDRLLRTPTQPYIILAKTVKGKGIPSMENAILWHGMAPTSEEDIKKARDGLSSKPE